MVGLEGLMGPSGYTTRPLYSDTEREREIIVCGTERDLCSHRTRPLDERVYATILETCTLPAETIRVFVHIHIPDNGESWYSKHNRRIHHLNHVMVYVLSLQSPAVEHYVMCCWSCMNTVIH